MRERENETDAEKKSNSNWGKQTGDSKSLTVLQQDVSEQNTAGCNLCRTVLGQMSLQQGQLREVVHHTHASGTQASNWHQSMGKVAAGHELQREHNGTAEERAPWIEVFTQKTWKEKQPQQ